MKKVLFFYNNGEINFHYSIKFSKKYIIKYKVLIDQTICIYYNDKFMPNIKEYLDKNAKLIFNSLNINNAKKLIDFYSKNIKLLGRSFDISWFFNHDEKKSFIKMDSRKIIYMFSRANDSYNIRKRNIIYFLYDQGEKYLNDLALKMIKKLKTKNVKIIIGKSLKKWVDINKQERILNISIISYILPLPVIMFIFEYKISLFDSLDSEYEIYYKTQLNYSNFSEIGKYLLLGL